MSQTNHAARLRELAEAEKEHAQSYARLSANEEKARNFGSAQYYATVADRRGLDAQALLAGAAALERTTPEPIGDKHRDGNWWLIGDEEGWWKGRWNKNWRRWEHSSGTQFLGAPTHALPLPNAPEVFND